ALRVAGLGLGPGGELTGRAVDDLDVDVRELSGDDVGEDVQVVVGHARVEDEMVLVVAATAAVAGSEGERCGDQQAASGQGLAASHVWVLLVVGVGCGRIRGMGSLDRGTAVLGGRRRRHILTSSSLVNFRYTASSTAVSTVRIAENAQASP